MEQKKQPNLLKGMYYRWKNDKGCSYIYARRIWIYCYRNRLKVPDDVLQIFADGVHKDHKNYQKHQFKKQSQLRKNRKKIPPLDHYFANNYLIHRYINFIVHISDGVTQDQAVYHFIDAVKKKYGKKDDGDYEEFGRIRQSYYRNKQSF